MNFSVDHKSKVPLHLQVEDIIRRLVADPEYSGGSFLPKEIDLAGSLGVSRSTIRQATNKLQQEGLITRKKGVGTTVARKKPLATESNPWCSFTQKMHTRGIQVIILQLKIEWTSADEKLCVFFNIDKGRQVFKLSKLKGTAGEPIVYCESYFHPRIGVNVNDDFRIPLYTMLKETYGVTVARSSENICSIQAGDVAQVLETAVTAPVLFRERFVYETGDKPVEYNVGYYRADKFTYSIEVHKR